MAFIDKTWQEVAHFLQSRSGWEVLYVCDGCTDGTTEELVRRAAKTKLPIRVLHYERNRGKGYAVRLGLQSGRGTFRLFTDVDLAYQMDMVDQLARELQGGAELVIASRAHTDSKVVNPDHMNNYLRRRKVQSFVFSSLARGLLGITNKDPQAGLKGMTARVARQVLPYVKCTGFGFDSELLVACRYLGIPIAEMPVRVVYDETKSTTKFSTSVRMVRELMRIRARWKALKRTDFAMPKPRQGRRLRKKFQDRRAQRRTVGMTIQPA
jgi:glycosyltransferase involved in cell wall biosynthesis